MEAEFLELLQAFQKNGKRLTTLNESILGFKEILENLRSEMDQLVELIQLEEIMTLAQNSTVILQDLEKQYDSMNQTYNRLLTTEAVRVQYLEHLNEIKDTITKDYETLKNYIHAEFSSIQDYIHTVDQKPSQSQDVVSTLGIKLNHYTYFKDVQEQSKLVIASSATNEKKVVPDFEAGKFQYHNNQLFIQNNLNQCLYISDGVELTLIIETVTANFHVVGYEIFDICEGVLQKTNLMTNKTEKLFENVLKFEIQGNVMMLMEVQSVKCLDINDLL